MDGFPYSYPLYQFYCFVRLLAGKVSVLILDKAGQGRTPGAPLHLSPSKTGFNRHCRPPQTMLTALKEQIMKSYLKVKFEK